MLLSNDYSIKEIKKSELKELAKYFTKYFKEIAINEALNEYEYEYLLKIMFENKNRTFFWFLIKNEKCGFAIISLEQNIPNLQIIKGRICEFYIFSNYRNKKNGIIFANVLFDYLKNKGASEIIIEVHFENKKAFNFWEKLGFKIKKYIMNKYLTIL